MLSLGEVQAIMARPKSLVSDMAWTYRHGKQTFSWLCSRMAVQFDDDVAVPEQFYVIAQWRKKNISIPEHWVFNLLYKGNRIYALHVQPTSIHENLVGKGRPAYKQEIGGLHEHTWSEEGDGYAEPIDLPLNKPEIVWKQFLKRAKISGGDFYHPDANQPELDL